MSGTLHDKHVALLELVNNSRTATEHLSAESYLTGWRQGVSDCDRRISLTAADLHYLDQGIDRPMCCGVFLDWKPGTTS